MTDGKFSGRLKALCNDYYETYMEVPPQPVSSHTRMNSLLAGTRKPTIEELVAISEAYDVSINYLVTGDEMFPSLRQMRKRCGQGIGRNRGSEVGNYFTGIIRETLIKAFPVPDLRREAANSPANPCTSTGGSKEMLIKSAFP